MVSWPINSSASTGPRRTPEVDVDGFPDAEGGGNGFIWIPVFLVSHSPPNDYNQRLCLVVGIWAAMLEMQDGNCKEDEDQASIPTRR